MDPILSPKTVALLRSLFAKDDNGDVYIRLIQGTPVGTLENSVNTQSSRSLETLLSSAIVLDENNNPALRVAEVVFGQTIQDFDNARYATMRANEAARQAAMNS